MREYTISTQDPEQEKDKDRADDLADRPENIVQKRNREEGIELYIDRMEDIDDFYNENDNFAVTNKDRNKYKSFVDGLEGWEKDVWERAQEDGHYFYFVDFDNVGGLITPLPLKLTYMNGDTEEMMIPAEIWRRNSKKVTKLITRKNRIKSIELDPHHQTADADFGNNSYPPVTRPGRLEMFKSDFKASSMMADMLVELKTDEDMDEDKDAETKGEMKSEEKDLPLKSGAKDKDKKKSYGSDSKSKKSSDAKSKKKKLDEKEKSSLRKTLEKMMGK